MWKYGLIKIEFDDLWEQEEDYCELVELYQDHKGEYSSFSRASIHSLEELNRVHADIIKDGVNNWFVENGEFSWNHEEKFWDWIKNDG